MATPSSSARAMIVSSRIEPPGWTIDRDARPRPRPRCRRGTGRTRRDAHAPPAARPAAFLAAISPDSTRFCWPAPMPDGLAVLHQHDRVRLHVPADAPRQLGVAPLGRRSAPRLVTTRQSSRVAAKWCGVLHQEPAADLAEVERSAAPAAGASRRRVFLRLAIERVDRARLVAGRDHDVGLRAGDHALDGGVVDRAVAARRCRRTRSARRTRARAGTRSARSSATATPHGLACLMMATRRPSAAEVVHEPPRGVGVVEVEVARAPCRRAASTPSHQLAVPADAVARAVLVRVLAVAQRLAGALAARGGVCCGQRVVAVCSHATIGGVVGRGVGERGDGRARGGCRRRRVPSLASARRAPASYCDGSVTTPTCAWFFAAARTIVGPPMSIGLDRRGPRANG